MAATMMGLVKATRGPGAELLEVPVPVCGPDEVLVRVKATSICGTDVHIYKWDAWAESAVVTPNVFGHEFAGIVEQVGEQVRHVRAGDHVSAEGHIVCGLCKACRTGNSHVCRHTKSFGISAPGCFADYAIVKGANVIPNPPEMPFELACLQDPLGNAVQTVLSGDIVGRSVAIIGMGPIGLMAVAVARACGAGRVIAVDINPYRLELAKTMGADDVINSAAIAMEAAVMDLTDGEGAEVVLEMSGHPDAIRSGFEVAAPAGRVSLLGIPTKEVSLDLSRHIIFKGLRIEGITGRRMYQTWYQLKGLLDRHRIDLSPLITHRFALRDYEEAFDLMARGMCGKIVFLHDANESTTTTKERLTYV
ncbi:L-threonine 3-dehydrogenase [Paenibacillus sacheonensis]|uniref:L-threonine 3-dehydrogenase n=1 Tax=Paenibacillus sacheonensis TaxID=742054 RepID=A0A7X4YT18_9BACL|nr:L-threonine 3-dehydrogenase [Paenibacillus sacheonensis]MBM7567761.1 threonine 3-dehydrogenase [Paenibacillus sacheonensis]NBC71965.1 L-threonine 3-dehydrogenase [Paenibacillus sacheonensis]